MNVKDPSYQASVGAGSSVQLSVVWNDGDDISLIFAELDRFKAMVGTLV
jgi:hypothetical protein